MWHCPHCGAPQAETARCWVCRRSSTTCSTCRHFRTSLAADVGYCALDRQRQPLTGRELRGCWTERPAAVTAASAAQARNAGRGKSLRAPAASPGAGHAPDVDRAPVRGFIPIDEVGVVPPAGVVEPAPGFLLGDPVESWETRTSLFGDAER